MREDRKSQLAIASVLLGMALIALLLISSLDHMAWPVASEINRINVFTSNPQSTPPGTLVVSLQSNESSFLDSAPTNGLPLPPGSIPRILPLDGVEVSILSPDNVPLESNSTNSTGQISEQLPPNSYTIRIFDWRLNNLTVPVPIYSDKVTVLRVTLDATAYGVQSFNIVDPDSSGFVVGWEQIYSEIPAQGNITAKGASTFLDTGFSIPALMAIMSGGVTSGSVTLKSENGSEVLTVNFFSPSNVLSSGMLTPVSISSTTVENGSQWVQLQIKSPLVIKNIQTMNLLSLKTVYSVNTSASL